MLKNRAFTIAAVIIAVICWHFDSATHYYLYGEPPCELMPHDIDELWLRSLMAMLIILLGIHADGSARKRLLREKRLSASVTYDAMLNASHHILNNLLNQMQLFRLEAQRNPDFDREILQHYDNAIDEAKGLVGKLSQIDNITAEDIHASIRPTDRQHDAAMTDARDPTSHD